MLIIFYEKKNRKNRDGIKSRITRAKTENRTVRKRRKGTAPGHANLPIGPCESLNAFRTE
jgi:hypothetical protein